MHLQIACLHVIRAVWLYVQTNMLLTFVGRLRKAEDNSKATGGFKQRDSFLLCWSVKHNPLKTSRNAEKNGLNEETSVSEAMPHRDTLAAVMLNSVTTRDWDHLWMQPEWQITLNLNQLELSEGKSSWSSDKKACMVVKSSFFPHLWAPGRVKLYLTLKLFMLLSPVSGLQCCTLCQFRSSFSAVAVHSSECCIWFSKQVFFITILTFAEYSALLSTQVCKAHRQKIA